MVLGADLERHRQGVQRPQLGDGVPRALPRRVAGSAGLIPALPVSAEGVVEISMYYVAAFEESQGELDVL